MKRKRNGRIHQGYTFKLRQDIAQLGLVGLQELATSRHIEKQVAYLKITSFRTSNLFLAFYLRTCNTQRSPQLLSFQTSAEFHLGNSSNRSQSLATKTHCTKGKQIGSLTNLRGSMTFKSKACVCFRHTLAVIDHLNGSLARIRYQHINMSGTCVNSIFHQFLDNRSRTLDYLAGCNLIGHRIGKQTNNITHRLTNIKRSIHLLPNNEGHNTTQQYLPARLHRSKAYDHSLFYV